MTRVKYWIVIFVITLLTSILMLIKPVHANWVFYNKIQDTSISLTVKLTEFFYKLNLPYSHEYPADAEGIINSEAAHKIIGGNVSNTEGRNGWEISDSNDGIGLADPRSPINAALTNTVLSETRPYILSTDYFDTNSDGKIDKKDKTAKEYFYGNNADPNLSFVIVRETFNNFFNQYYTIYTTTVPLGNLNINSDVKYVYKTRLLWKWKFSISDLDAGKYNITTTGNVRGVCKLKNISTVNNVGNLIDNKFFDYNTFKTAK